VLRASRADAQAILMESAQYMERYFTTNNSYANAVPLSLVSPKGASGTAIKYNITPVKVTTATTFTLTATPANSQTADNTTCGTLSISNTGVQSPATAGCW